MSLDSIDRLETIRSQMADWIKFLEAKNAAIVVFSSSVFFASLKVYSGIKNELLYKDIYFLDLWIFLLASVAISLVSLAPRLSAPYWIKFPEKTENDNPLFFGDICKYSKIEYFKLISNKLLVDEKSFELANIYCEQITVNAKISYIKSKSAKWAVYLVLCGILTPIGAYFLLLVRE